MSTHLSLAIPGIVTGEADGLVAVIALVVIVVVLVVGRRQPGSRPGPSRKPRA